MNQIIGYLESIGLYKGVTNLVLKMSILMMAFYAPIKSLILTLLGLVLLDLITGLVGALRKKQRITSAKLSRTITKTLVYLLTVSVVHLVSEHVILSEDIPLTSMVSSFIILTELQSIFENLNKITRNNVLVLLIDKLSLVTKGRPIIKPKREKKYKAR